MKNHLFLPLILISICFVNCVEKRDLTTNTVIVQISYTPTGLHPTNGNSSLTSFIHEYTQKGLLGVDLTTEKTKPILLKNLPSVDSTGLLYTYELRDDVYWDNGEKLSAKDVVYTVKTLLCPLTNNADVRPIYSSIIDSVYFNKKNSHQFFLKAKNKHILNSEVLEGLPIQQKSRWDSTNVLDQLSFKQLYTYPFESSVEIDEWFNKFNNADNAYVPENLVGLGPYQVTAFEKDNYITLVRKENWWGNSLQGTLFDNYPEKIIFKIIKDNSAVYLAIKNQEIDFTQSAGGTSKLLKLQNLDYFNNNYSSEFVSSYSYSYLGLNMRPDGSKQTPFFTDKKVRRAIAHLVPVNEIIEVLSYGKAERQASIVSPLKQSCDTSLKFIELNIEKAKQLLQESGWTDTDGDQIVDKIIQGKKTPFSFKLNYIASGSAKDAVFMMKESMKKAGVELIANPMDFNSHYQKAGNHEFDAILGGWLAGSSYSDPTQLWSTESWTNKGSNFCGFGNSTSDSLIVKANTSLNPEEHLKAYQKLQQLIYDEQPYVFLWSGKMPMVAHKRFKNTNFYRAKPNTSLGSYQLAN